MIRRCFFFVVALVASLTTLACAPTVRWGQPVSMSEYTTNDYLDANMLTVARRRFALPEGWSFRRRRDTDAERIKLWIHDTGGNKATGAYGWEFLRFPISGSRAAEKYAEITMKEFSDTTVQRTEIDDTEAYLFQSVKGDMKWRRLTAVLFDSSPEGTGVSDITFLGDEQSFDSRTLHGIIGTFKFMPRGLSERKIKGSFSFKSDDGALVWADDYNDRVMKKGFRVIGKVPNGSVILAVAQVSTRRFGDFLNMKLFTSAEIQTTLRLAGGSYPARAVHRDDEKKKIASTVYLFERAGRDYMFEVFRGFDASPGPVDPAMHEDVDIVALLEKKFYFHE